MKCKLHKLMPNFNRIEVDNRTMFFSFDKLVGIITDKHKCYNTEYFGNITVKHQDYLKDLGCVGLCPESFNEIIDQL